MWNRSSKREKTYNYTSFYQSAFTWPVRPVLPTGQTGRHYPEASTGQTGPTDRSDRSTQNRGATHSTLQCATQQLPSLGVSLHHLPPLCIPADEFDTAGAKVNIRVPWNKNMVAINPEQLILSKTYPTSEYNLAHIPRHSRLLAGSYFAEKRLK